MTTVVHTGTLAVYALPGRQGLRVALDTRSPPHADMPADWQVLYDAPVQVTDAGLPEFATAMSYLNLLCDSLQEPSHVDVMYSKIIKRAVHGLAIEYSAAT